MGGDIPMTGSHRTQSAPKAPIAEEATPRQGAITLSAHMATNPIGRVTRIPNDGWRHPYDREPSHTIRPQGANSRGSYPATGCYHSKCPHGNDSNRQSYPHPKRWVETSL